MIDPFTEVDPLVGSRAAGYSHGIASPEAPETRRIKTQTLIMSGFVFGLLTGIALGEVGFGVFLGVAGGHLPLAMGIFGALAMRTRVRRILWGVSAIAVIVYLVVSYTPLSDWLMRSLVIDEMTD